MEYFELINWTDLRITEPSLLKTVMDTELQQFIVMDVTPTIVFPEFFYHLQAVGSRDVEAPIFQPLPPPSLPLPLPPLPLPPLLPKFIIIFLANNMNKH